MRSQGLKSALLLLVLASTATAQRVRFINPGSVTIDHVGIRQTACNGQWDFIDTNGNRRLDPGEPREPFQDTNRDGQRDEGRNPVRSIEDARQEVDLINAVWAQVCIEFRDFNLRRFPTRRFMGGATARHRAAARVGIFVRQPPAAEPFQDNGRQGQPAAWAGNGMFDFADANGNSLHDAGELSEPFTDCNRNGTYDWWVDLSDGSLDEYPAPNRHTREEKSLIETLGDQNPATLDFFVVNALSNGNRGEAFWQAMAPISRRNCCIVPQAQFGRLAIGSPRDYINSAHETAHVLLDSGAHLANRTNILSGAFPGDSTDRVTGMKRITAAQRRFARTGQTTAVLRVRR